MSKKGFGDVDSFVVDRRTWLRGNGPDSSSLLDDNGCGCCLGHYAKACSLPDELIQSKETPEAVNSDSLGYKVLAWKTKLLSPIGDNSDFLLTDTCTALMLANDNTKTSDFVREKRLTELFSSIGIAVKFEN